MSNRQYRVFPALSADDGWAPVPGYEGYFVNREGQVRTRKYGRDKLIQRIKSPNHWLYVFRPSPDVSRAITVEDLLAEVFLGPCPEGHAVFVPRDWPGTLEGVEYRPLVPWAWEGGSPEDWKRIPGTVGYWACADGRIWSSHIRRIMASAGRDDGGYRMLSLLREDGVKRGISIHRAVALAFFGVPAAGMVVDHINGDKDDNRRDNLRYISHSENIRAAHQCGLVAPRHSGRQQVRVRLNLLKEKLLSLGVPEHELAATIESLRS